MVWIVFTTFLWLLVWSCSRNQGLGENQPDAFPGRNVWNFKIPGHFFVRSTDLLSLPNVNPDTAFGMQVQREHINYKISQFLWNMEFFMICVGVDRRGPQRLTRGEFSSILVFNFILFGTTTDQILTLMLSRWAFRQLSCTRRARERGE